MAIAATVTSSARALITPAHPADLALVFATETATGDHDEELSLAGGAGGGCKPRVVLWRGNSTIVPQYTHSRRWPPSGSAAPHDGQCRAVGAPCGVLMTFAFEVGGCTETKPATFYLR
jgi:hypothetical protein